MCCSGLSVAHMREKTLRNAGWEMNFGRASVAVIPSYNQERISAQAFCGWSVWLVSWLEGAWYGPARDRSWVLGLPLGPGMCTHPSSWAWHVPESCPVSCGCGAPCRLPGQPQGSLPLSSSVTTVISAHSQAVEILAPFPLTLQVLLQRCGQV